jgi:hypothetical protein
MVEQNPDSPGRTRHYQKEATVCHRRGSRYLYAIAAIRIIIADRRRRPINAIPLGNFRQVRVHERGRGCSDFELSGHLNAKLWSATLLIGTHHVAVSRRHAPGRTRSHPGSP